jgi:hypothetical protein
MVKHTIHKVSNSSVSIAIHIAEPPLGIGSRKRCQGYIPNMKQRCSKYGRYIYFTSFAKASCNAVMFRSLQEADVAVLLLEV